MVFERFTQRAREAVVLALEETVSLGHDHVGTEHLLLGLLREDSGPAAETLRHLQIRHEDARLLVVQIVGEGKDSRDFEIPHAERARLALEGALRETLALGHNAIGTGHILLGLMRNEQEGSTAVRVLRRLGTSPKQVRTETVARIPPQSENEIQRRIRLGGGELTPTGSEPFGRTSLALWDSTRTGPPLAVTRPRAVPRSGRS